MFSICYSLSTLKIKTMCSILDLHPIPAFSLPAPGASNSKTTEESASPQPVSGGLRSAAKEKTGEIDISFTLDFWDSFDSSRTLLGRKKFTVEEIQVERVLHFGDLIAIADKLIQRRKWAIQQINPDDFWVKSKQKFEFRYFYKDSRIKVDWPFPEETSIALLAETVLRQKGLKRKIVSDKKTFPTKNTSNTRKRNQENLSANSKIGMQKRLVKLTHWA